MGRNPPHSATDTPTRPALAPGLYLVATPIGNAADITLRALDILSRADVLAAEDTRNTRHLMQIHGVRLDDRPLLPYHDHNGPAMRPRLIAAIRDGQAVAYVSDAGTPLVADPGYRLAQEVIAAGLPVTAAPGPSAVLAALAVAGLPTDRFTFAGFAPQKSSARRAFLAEFAAVPTTLVLFESARRLASSLRDMAEVFGPDRPAAICRELTKKFEQVRRGSLGDLATALSGEAAPKGEIVVVLAPPPPARASADDLDTALRAALAQGSLKEAVADVTAALGLPRRAVYARALQMTAT